MKGVLLERDYYTHHVMTLTVAVCDHGVVCFEHQF